MLARIASPALVIGMVAALSGAGCEPTGAACDFRKGSTSGVQQRCQDYHNQPTYNRQRTACDEAKATWLGTDCPREGAVGGCMWKTADSGYYGGGYFQIDWYYAEPGRTAETVRAVCMGAGATFLDP